MFLFSRAGRGETVSVVVLDVCNMNVNIDIWYASIPHLPTRRGDLVIWRGKLALVM